jgi:hypothetical protein
MWTKHLRERARARKGRPWFFFAPTFKSSLEIYLYIEGLTGVRKPEYLDQLRFFIRLLGKRTFLESGEKE